MEILKNILISFGMIRIVVLIVLLQVCQVAAQMPDLRHYTANEGLANSMVYYALQDSKGFIWFCTESGVNRFDGHTFEVFTTNDGLADNENFRCIEDKRGRIWFASYNGRLSYFNGSTFINETTDPTLHYTSSINRHIMDLLEDEDGHIWFSRFFDEAVYRYDGKKITSFKRSDYSHFPNKLFFTYHHSINYLKGNAGHLYRQNLSSGDSTLLMQSYSNNDAIINTCRLRISDDEFYFNSRSGMIRFRRDSAFCELKPAELGLTNEQTFLFFTMAGNDLWLATSKGGLFFIPQFKTKGFTGVFRHYLHTLSVSCVITDNEGGVWATTLSEGVFYIPAPSAYVTNIPGESITSVKQNPWNGLRATGSYYGRLQIDSAGKLLRAAEFEPGMLRRIKGLHWLNDRKLIVGTDFTCYVYDVRSGKRNFIVKGPHFEQGFSDMDEGTAGIWLEGRSDIVLIREGQVEDVFRLAPYNTEKLVSIADGGGKGCWFTTLTGLYWFDLASRKAIKLADNNVFKANLKDLAFVKGILWVATDGNGLFLFKNNKPVKHVYSGNSEITSNMCRKLLYDGTSNLWVATNKGISVLNTDSAKYVMSLSADDILINNDIRDLDLCRGTAYIATPAGISTINVNKFVAVTAPPELYLRYLQAGDVLYAPHTTPSFSYSAGLIRLVYTALTFQANSSLHYRYKLQREGAAWNETRQGQLEFYGLAPGTYTVLASARKYNSDWCAPVTFSFTVLPLWYQSWVFKALVIILVLGSIALIAYRVILSNRQKNEARRRILESELRAIRLHMNPHFIFNSLTSLQLFILQKRGPEANDYISRFSRLIRWIMQYSNKQEISLKEEIVVLNTYLELEQLRFAKPFTVAMTIAPEIDVSTTVIPPLVIQPFVENAIKYGLAGRPEKGQLKLDFRKDKDLLLVTLEDNGVGRDAVRREQSLSGKEHESTGIKYTGERLRLLLGSRKGITPVKITDLFDHEGQAIGTRVELILPLLL